MKLSPEATNRLAFLEGWADSKLRGAGEFLGAEERTDDEIQTDERLEEAMRADETLLLVARRIKELVFLLDASRHMRGDG